LSGKTDSSAGSFYRWGGEQARENRKVVSFYTSRDFAISEPALDATVAVGHAGNFDELLKSHALQWDHLWTDATSGSRIATGPR
jgi:trehalose/maltose hydrolase-like predicted phosphorylase